MGGGGGGGRTSCQNGGLYRGQGGFPLKNLKSKVPEIPFSAFLGEILQNLK